ncbi:ssDNA-binding protein [Deinococcus multiflagellatus]|uniref:SsDNA-binding protein n=1 Tax=Deinococcus multiflagellatus TaxID=1656887 RepID=A0ABW1ZNV6_9DEIO|nr:ssDNA-binding protein [Deinococcus multiflagellatus]MBZ9714957.1 ssDNA-binding protein [Deinococcus multiflagellatus]
MPARFVFLGALCGPVNGPLFTLAGTETINHRGRVREMPFYHTLTAATPELLKGLTTGAPYLAEGEVRPLPGSTGQVALQVEQLTTVAALPTTTDRAGGYVLTRGINQVIASGHLASDIRLQILPGPDQASVVNVSLRIFRETGLLETSSYGRAAQALAGGRKGDPVVLFGRLHSERKTNGAGLSRTYSRLETYRPTVGST